MICAKCKKEKLCTSEPTHGTMLFGGQHPRFELRCAGCERKMAKTIVKTMKNMLAK